MALRLLFHEPLAARERLRNKEEIIMDWTSLWITEMVVACLGVFALDLIYREEH